MEQKNFSTEVNCCKIEITKSVWFQKIPVGAAEKINIYKVLNFLPSHYDFTDVVTVMPHLSFIRDRVFQFPKPKSHCQYGHRFDNAR